MKSANYINHIALVLDASGSMHHLTNQVVQVADNQIAHLAVRSKELDQETRVTVYTFADPLSIHCHIYDKDVLRMPSIKGLYHAGGNTALIDATLKAIDDLDKTAQLYGDHAFLVYVLTDGAENYSRQPPDTLHRRITTLADNWTIAAFVPSQTEKFEAKKFGFPSDNVAIWDTTAKGMSEVGETLRKVTDNYMQSRATGVRGSRNLFSLADAVAHVSKADVAKLNRLHPGQYRMIDVKKDDEVIAPFVERSTKRAYKLGEAFYQLSKPEKIQPQKDIALYERKSHAVYTGKDARSLLKLPDYEVKVAPASHPDYDIYVQSTSVNRKLVAGTKVLLLSGN